MKYLGYALITLAIVVMAVVSFEIFAKGHSMGLLVNAAGVAIPLAMAGAGVAILRQAADPMHDRLARKYRRRSR